MINVIYFVLATQKMTIWVYEADGDAAARRAIDRLPKPLAHTSKSRHYDCQVCGERLAKCLAIFDSPIKFQIGQTCLEGSSASRFP